MERNLFLTFQCGDKAVCPNTFLLLFNTLHWNRVVPLCWIQLSVSVNSKWQYLPRSAVYGCCIHITWINNIYTHIPLTKFLTNTMKLNIPQIVNCNPIFCSQERVKLNLYNSLSTWHSISSIVALSENLQHYCYNITRRYISNLYGDKPPSYVIVYGSSFRFHAVLGQWGNVYSICMRICLEKCLMALKYYATPASSYTYWNLYMDTIQYVQTT